jgi:hypothetical protein
VCRIAVLGDERMRLSWRKRGIEAVAAVWWVLLLLQQQQVEEEEKEEMQEWSS